MSLASTLPLAPAAESSRRLRTWLTVAGIALVLHAIVLGLSRWAVPPAAKRPIEVTTVTPEALSAARRQWKNRALLLKQPPSARDSVNPPDQARYDSDRNRRVERETRAARSDVLPRPGAPGRGASRPANRTPPAPRTTRANPRPNLADLGIPYDLSPPPVRSEPEQASRSTPDSERGGSDGAEQSLVDSQLPTGSQNLLNTVESRYYSFYSRLYESIGPLWQSRVRSTPLRRSVAAGQYTTIVELVLDAAGEILEIRRLQSSGVPEFDAAVDASWRSVGRFPNPPRGLQDSDGRVTTGWTFTVVLDRSFRVTSPDPERIY